ncbi:MAG TPA: nitroreductase family protein [Synergistales bacterium]|nr:nitroreductase family protein [Synergistales bacterium]
MPVKFAIVAGMICFLLLSFYLSHSSVKEYRNKVISMDAIRKGINISEELEEILYYGTLAPSSHNAQMWKIRIISPDTIELLLDKERTLSEVDPDNREAMISLGAFLENISQAARIHGSNAEISLLVERPFDERIARIHFEKTTALSQEEKEMLRRNLSLRDTVRSPFKKEPLRDEHVSSLIEQIPGKAHYYPIDSREGEYLKQGLIASNERQAKRDDAQKELSRWFRFSDEDARKTGDGITPEMMGLKGISRWFVSHFFTTETVMKDSFRKQTVSTVRKQVENCSGYLILTSQGNDPFSLINQGMELERIWLHATGMGVAIHPISQMIEEDPWKSELKEKLELNSFPQMMLRVGYIDRSPDPVSRRRPVSAIIDVQVKGN